MLDKPITLVVTSKNAAKIDAALTVAREFFPQITSVVGVSSESSVSETPVGDEEALVGCQNRIDFVKRSHPDADFYVSIEGAVDIIEERTFVYSWVVVEHLRSHRLAFGCSAKVQIPPVLARKVEHDQCLSQLAAELYKTDENVNEVGTNGLITLGAFTRTDEFKSALRCAFGYLANDQNY